MKSIFLFKRYYIFFLCINIFLPKVNFGFGSFYLFEFINVLLFLVILNSAKIPNNKVVWTYAVFMAVCFITFLFGVIKFQFIDWMSLARLMKFTFFIFYLIIPYYLRNVITDRDLTKVINYQIVFFLLAGSYVLFNMVTNPQSVSEYMWGYDNKYRLIGLTGYAIDLTGTLERLENTTSVSMGVFVAFIFLIQLAIYRQTNNKTDLLKTIILVPLELLVYSRAGLLVMGTGLIYYLILNLKPSLLLKLGFLFGISIIGLVIFGSVETLLETGTLSKLSNLTIKEDPRYQMIITALQYFTNHPLTIILGNGFGEAYTQLAIGYPHLESLFLTTWFTSGLLAITILFAHFLFTWFSAKRISKIENSQFQPFAYGFRLFVPGWFLSAFVAGNTFQTDFYFPIIYILLFTPLYFKSKKVNDTQEQIILQPSKK